jgi:hypothetical protein
VLNSRSKAMRTNVPFLHTEEVSGSSPDAPTTLSSSRPTGSIHPTGYATDRPPPRLILSLRCSGSLDGDSATRALNQSTKNSLQIA